MTHLQSRQYEIYPIDDEHIYALLDQAHCAIVRHDDESITETLHVAATARYENRDLRDRIEQFDVYGENGYAFRLSQVGPPLLPFPRNSRSSRRWTWALSPLVISFMPTRFRCKVSTTWRPTCPACRYHGKKPPLPWRVCRSAHGSPLALRMCTYTCKTRTKEHPPMRKTVLIIDDSPTIRVIVEQQLQQLGLRTRSFADGIEALHWLSTSQDIPDVLWLDVHLPKLDGYEIVRRLKLHPRYSATTIVFMSSSDIARDRLKGMGTTYYLHKPFTIAELLSVTQNALAFVPPSPSREWIGKGK